MIRLEVHPFRADCTDKDAAVKVLEEAAEVYGAWQTVAWVEEKTSFGHPAKSGDVVRRHFADELADEIADFVTACCNLAARNGIDLQTALDRVRAKNEERGRYA